MKDEQNRRPDRIVAVGVALAQALKNGTERKVAARVSELLLNFRALHA